MESASGRNKGSGRGQGYEPQEGGEGGGHRWVVSRSWALPLRGPIGGARALKERPIERQLRPRGEKTGDQRPLGGEGWCKGNRRSRNRLGRN